MQGRMAITQRDGLVVIDDTYNANPDSLRAALEVLRGIECTGRKIAVIGDMLELGPMARRLHAEAGSQLFSSGVDVLLTVGPLACALLEAARQEGLAESASRSFAEPEGAADFLWGMVRSGDVILVKGSRGMQMERVLACFTTSTR